MTVSETRGVKKYIPVMNTNEKIYIKSFDCEIAEDDFEHGQQTEVSGFWSMDDLGFQHLYDGYSSIEDALKAICEANSFSYDKNNWLSFGKEYGEDFGRFDCDVLVNDDNSQASSNEIEVWKLGQKKLWNCHIVVYLEVRTVRELTADEANAF